MKPARRILLSLALLLALTLCGAALRWDRTAAQEPKPAEVPAGEVVPPAVPTETLPVGAALPPKPPEGPSAMAGEPLPPVGVASAVVRGCPIEPEAGALEGTDPVYHRNYLAGSECYISPTGTAVYYDVYSFHLSGSNPHDLIASTVGGTAVDTLLTVYQAPDGAEHPFDPAAPCANSVAFGDDFGGSYQSRVEAGGLQSGWVDVVLSTYFNGHTDSYTLTVTSASCGHTVRGCPIGAETGALTTESPVYNRIVTPNPCQLSGTGTRVYYAVHSYRLAGPGPHDLLASTVGGTVMDTTLTIYQATGGVAHPFDPAHACANALAYNDDDIGLQSRVSTTGLGEGWVDVVLSTYANNTTGPYTLTVTSGNCLTTVCLPVVVR